MLTVDLRPLNDLKSTVKKSNPSFCYDLQVLKYKLFGSKNLNMTFKKPPNDLLPLIRDKKFELHPCHERLEVIWWPLKCYTEKNYFGIP